MDQKQNEALITDILGKEGPKTPVLLTELRHRFQYIKDHHKRIFVMTRDIYHTGNAVVYTIDKCYPRFVRVHVTNRLTGAKVTTSFNYANLIDKSKRYLLLVEDK